MFGFERVKGMAGRTVGKLREERKTPLRARISDLNLAAWLSFSCCLVLTARSARVVLDLVRSVVEAEGVMLYGLKGDVRGWALPSMEVMRVWKSVTVSWREVSEK